MRFNPILPVLILFLFISSLTKAQDKITAAQIRMTTTVYLNGESGNFINDSIQIYYFQNLVLYKLNYINTFGVSADSNEPIKVEIKNIWFVHEANNKNGYAFYEEKEKPDNWANVDSFVRGHGMPQVGPFELDTNSRITKLSSKQLHGNMVKEEFIFKAPANSRDTMCFTFSNSLNHIPFSFDKKLDAARGKKLCLINMICGAHPSSDNKTMVPQSNSIIELKEIPVDNPQKVSAYFAQFRTLKKE